jgi:hypothetical protein
VEPGEQRREITLKEGEDDGVVDGRDSPVKPGNEVSSGSSDV